MLPLPKELQNHPRLAELERRLAAAVAPLKEGSAVAVWRLSFGPELKEALAGVHRSHCLVQGLEAADATLEREQRGLRAAADKAGRPQARRLSRLLLVANDGSDRFYRQVERLLSRHDDRLWAVRLDVPAAELGAALTPKGGPAKAFLIAEREALARLLGALA